MLHFGYVVYINFRLQFVDVFLLMLEFLWYYLYYFTLHFVVGVYIILYIYFLFMFIYLYLLKRKPEGGAPANTFLLKGLRRPRLS